MCITLYVAGQLTLGDTDESSCTLCVRKVSSSFSNQSTNKSYVKHMEHTTFFYIN